MDESVPAVRPERGPLATLAALLFVAALGLWGWQAWRERFLCDDAFISFRYADHLARGLGLVWNEGEPIEGYSNFLWVLLMAAGMKCGLAPEGLSQVLGALSGAALLGALAWAGARASGRWLAGAAMALVLAAHGSFAAWSTSGLETMFFALLVWLATWRFLVELEHPTRVSWAGLLFALAALTRPEAPLYAGLCGLHLLFARLRGRATTAALARFALAFAVPVALHLAWRWSTYGDWLPNTFRAKVPGTWFEQGFHYLWLYQVHYHALWFAPLAVLAWLGPRRSEASVLATALLATLVYVASVGGDRFEFRFLIVILPHFTWLTVEGARQLVARRGFARVLALAALGALFVVHLRGFAVRPVARNGVATVQAVEAYLERRTAEGKRIADWIERGLFPRELVLCVGGAGAVPYYTRWTTVDRRGLNDRTIARLPVAERGVIAHEREAPYDYLVERRVAVFDVLNRLIMTPEELMKGRKMQHEGRPLEMRAIRLDGVCFVFATFLAREELAALFPGLEVLEPPK